MKNDNEKELKRFNSKIFKVIPIVLIVLVIIFLVAFNYLFNNFTPILRLENNGFIISTKVSPDTLRSSLNDDNKVLNVVDVKENEYIYKTLNNYVNNDRKELVDIYYPIYINDGLSIINYNEDTNLIDANLERSIGLSSHVYSYGNVYNLSDYEKEEDGYLLLSYPNGVYVNLYDLKIKTEVNEYNIPLNSFIYFEEDKIGYFERNNSEFIRKEIIDVDYNSTIAFYYESAKEDYHYTYEEFLIGIGKLYKKDDIIVPNKPIVKEEDIIEEVVDDEEKPVIKQPDFVWIKPTVSVDGFIPNVYSASTNLVLNDPAGVITKAPTFTVISSGRTYSRRTFYSNGKIYISGLTPNSEFQIMGQYTYLDEDLVTKKMVTFYLDTINTLDTTNLSAIDINYTLGNIYSKKLELATLKIVSDLNSEVMRGIRNISFTVNGEDYYIPKQKYVSLINGEEVKEVSSSESLNSNSEYDFEIIFYDVSGNKLVVNNNKGHSRTSKKMPTAGIKIIENEVDYVTIGIDLRNEDNIVIDNYKYIVTNTSGKVVNEGSIDGDRLTLYDLDPNQIFNFKIIGDFDLNDNQGLRKEYVINEVEFSSLPISSLGFINLNVVATDIKKDSFSIEYQINNKTDYRLIKLLKELNISLYEEGSDRLIRDYRLNQSALNELKNKELITISYSNLNSNTSYYLVISSIVRQGETEYNLETIHNFPGVTTRKKEAQVVVENSFTTNDMIDFDVKVIDEDGAILSEGVRVELRDNTNKLIDSRVLDVNTDFQRITYNYLKKNQNYVINFIVDEYNETNNNEEFQPKYLLAKFNKFTQEGITGKVELRRAIRIATGNNLVDSNSESKWVQTYDYYTIPKTMDDDGNMHIFSRTGSASYMYDLSDYHGEIVTASFKIKTVTPLNEAFKLYFTNYLGTYASISTSYYMLINNISEDKWTTYTYTFRVGSYRSGNHFVNNNNKYYGKYRCDFVGFYFTGGNTSLAEYMIKDFEVHISRDRKEIDLSNYTIEKGTYNSNGLDNNSGTYNDYRARLSDGIILEGDNVYEFDFAEGNDYSAYIYFTDMNNKYISAYGWFDNKRTIYVPNNTKVYLTFRYFSGNMPIDPENIHLKITKYQKKDNIPYEDFKYNYVTSVKVNLSDLRDEITNNTYYLKVTDSDTGEKVKTYEFEDLVDTNTIDEEKNIDLEEQKNYNVTLFFKIRDRDYELDSFDISTNSEVVGISSLDDWAYIQPRGNYIVLNDLDFKNFTLQTLGWGYRYFNGIIDFQGYSADVYSETTAYQRIGRIDKKGILKNMVLNVHLNNEINNNSIRGFVSSNYGLIDNIQIHIFDERIDFFNDTYLNTLVDVNYADGIIQNFFIKLENEVNIYREVGLLTRYNYGKVLNGYVYGANAIATLETEGVSTRPVALIQRYGGVKSIVKNVYTLSSIEFPKNLSYDLTGLVSYETYGKLENVYTVGNVSNVNQAVGPVVGYLRATGEFDKVYYLSDYVYTTPNQTKITALNLNDVSFQESLFGDSFNVSEMIKLGYYPQVRFSFKKMPKQEYIELPNYDSNNIIDIVDMEILERGNSTSKVQMVVDNPLGEDITSISIADLSTAIIEQTYEDGKSYVIFETSNPAVYTSRYAVKSISSRSFNGFVSTKSYTLGEKYLFIDFYKEIHDVSDWIKINNFLNQNYILESDLDFTGYVNYYIGSFTGKINGNNHVLKNISITSKDGLFTQMNGTLENIFFENVYKTSDSTNSGLIGYSNQNAKFNNVHLKNVNITVPETRTSDTLYLGSLVGQVYYSKFTNVSAVNVNLISKVSISNVHIGGLVGYSNGGVYSNSFVQNLNILLENAKNTLGIGGIIGREVASVASIVDSYAVGKISTNGRNTGGIVGSSVGFVENCMSYVNIYSELSSIGGIAGYVSTPANVTNNLALGNITTKLADDFIGYIIGNDNVDESNRAYEGILINGEKKELSREVSKISYIELLNKNNYQDDEKLNLGESFDYSKVNMGILPKLFYIGKDILLPNQEDIYLEQEFLAITDYSIDKHTDYSTIVFYINNPDNKNIKSVTIDDMNVEITDIKNENGITILQAEAYPIRYYDSYLLSSVNYLEDDKEVPVSKMLLLDMPFYKRINNYNDWQNVSTYYPENYLLTNDIDFTGLSFNNNVVFNILETESNNVRHTLKGMTLNVNKAGNNINIISRVNTSLKNIDFEDISIVDEQKTSNNYINIINYLYGDMENVSFKNITINAPYKSYVGMIGQSYTNKIDNVNLDLINITGKNYISGFLAYYYNNNENRTISNVNATNVTVNGTGNYVGGVFATQSSETTVDEKFITNINIADSSIVTTGNYVGALVGYGSCNDSNVTNVYIKGNQYVGGAFGYAKNNYTRFVTVKDSNIEVVSYYGGGIAGQTRYLYDSVVDNTTITGLGTGTYGVGGLIGFINGYTNYRNVVKDSQIINNGMYTGGIAGNMTGGTIHTASAHNLTITGYSETGGIAGKVDSGSITTSKVTECFINATEGRAGGIIGYLNNLNEGVTFREGYFRHTLVTKTNVTGKSYVGGLIGTKNEKLVYPNEDYSLYFEGNVSADDDITYGIATGDNFNKEIMNLGRTGFYENSLLKNVPIKNKVNESISDNLVTDVTLGFINTSTGVEEMNYNYPNAYYTNYIKLDAGNVYRVKASNKNKSYSDIFRIRLYDIDKNYLVDYYGTPSYVWKYFADYNTFTNMDEVFLTPIKDSYIRIQSYYELENVEVVKVSSTYDDLSKDKLLNAGILRNRITWNRYLSDDNQDYYYKTFFSLDGSYWDFSPLNNEVTNIEINDKSGKNHHTTANVTVIQDNGLFFGGNNDYMEVPNFTPNNDITISTDFISYSSRSWQYLFSYRNPNNSNQGIGVFIHGKTLYVTINGSNYSTSYTIPHYQEMSVTVTYQNNKTLKVYVNGDLIYTHDNVKKTIGKDASSKTYIGTDTYYNSNSYKYLGIIKNMVVYNRALSQTEILNNYTSSGITNMDDVELLYDFNNISYNNVGYYPIHKWSSTDIILREQALVPLPTGSEITGLSIRPLGLSRRGLSTFQNTLDGKYHIYPSSINTINLEFDKISDDLSFTYKINDNEYQENVTKRVYSLYYDYNSNIEITIKNAFESKTINLSKEDLSKTILVYNDNYYHLDNNNLYKNNNLIARDIVNLYNNLALSSNGKIYNLDTFQYQDIYVQKGILSKNIALYDNIINNKVVKTYYNYTEIIDSNDNVIERNDLIIYKDGNIYIYQPDSNNINNSLIVNNYNNSSYEFILSKNKELYSYQTELKSNDYLVNSDIIEISSDYNSNNPVIMIKYVSGQIIVLNYYSGEKLFEYGNNSTISLFDFIGLSLKSNNFSNNNSSYNDSNNLISELNNLTDEEVKNVLDSIKNNNNNNNNNNQEINDNYTIDNLDDGKEAVINKNVIKNTYVTSYNSDTKTYDIYDIDDILNIKMADIPTVNEKITQNAFLNNYFKKGTRIDEIFKDNKNIIYTGIILLIIINLLYLIFRLRKGERHA